jgi:hypothetical protein
MTNKAHLDNMIQATGATKAEVKVKMEEYRHAFAAEMIRPAYGNNKATVEALTQLVREMNALTDALAADGVEVGVNVQRVPVCGWRYLKPVVKMTLKPGKPV